MNKNSLLYWFPKIKDLPLNYPETIILPIDKYNINYSEVIYKNKPFPSDFVNDLYSSAEKISKNFEKPFFMRTAHFSGKHDWIFTCYIDNVNKLLPNLRNLIDLSFSAGIIGLPIEAIVLREFLELDWKFRAFLGTPISRERRYFIKYGKVLCHHPYWIEDAIWFSKDFPEVQNWKELLRELNTETEEEIKELSHYSKLVAERLRDYWSVDFAMAKNKKWYLIDMALGDQSWHDNNCKAVKL